MLNRLQQRNAELMRLRAAAERLLAHPGTDPDDDDADDFDDSGIDDSEQAATDELPITLPWSDEPVGLLLLSFAGDEPVFSPVGILPGLSL